MTGETARQPERALVRDDGATHRPTGARRVLRPPRSFSLWAVIFVVVVAAAGTLSWWVNSGGESGRLGRAVLVAVNLSRGDLAGARLEGADLRRAELNETDLTAADLEGADLSGVRGSNVILRFACLRRTSWHGAHLSNVDLTRADVRGADLSKVSSVTVKSTYGLLVDGSTKLPPGAKWHTVLARDRNSSCG